MEVNAHRMDYTLNVERDLYRQAARELDQAWSEDLLADLPAPDDTASGEPELRWSADQQRIDLAGLTPGRLVRINYAYFPYWTSSRGAVFRGLSERIFFVPDAEQAELTFSRFSARSSWVGAILSGVAVLGIVLRARRQGRTTKRMPAENR